MTHYVRRGNYIVPANEPRARHVTGRDGQRVYFAGCNLNAAMYPTEPDKFDPSGGLIAELEAQRRARMGGQS